MKKKIIFITTALWVGGIETALVNLLNQLDYDKYEVTCLIIRAELDLKDQINPNCRLIIVDREDCYSFGQVYRYKRLYHLTEESTDPSRLHKIMMRIVPAIKYLENAFYINYIKGFMEQEQFDTAIIYSDVVAEITIKAIRAKKYLMYYHHGAMRHVYHDRIAYKRCKNIIAVSKNQANELKRFVPKYADKISVIHNVADVEGIRKKGQMNIKETFDTSQFNIVSVGRVSHEKGMDLAVRVCARLVFDGYRNVKWWIVGDGPAMQEIKDVISETHMDQYMVLTGMKENPYPYIKKADLYVQPSRFEGYPMTILEALILGQPVISTNNYGAREIVVNNKTGILCDITEKSIVYNIEKIMNKKEWYQSLKNNVRNINWESGNRECMRKFENLI